MKVSQLLSATHAKLEKLRAEAEKDYSKRAPKFNSIELLQPGEVALTRVLRELLDPNGVHAQGQIFLDLFLEHLGLNNIVDNKEVLNIKTEVLTDSNLVANRFIDLLIEFKGISKNQKIAVAIENKPWASDGEKQIHDYLKHLSTSYPAGYALIYLSGEEGRQPAEHSIGKDALEQALKSKTIQLSSYNRILPWLSACKAKCEAKTVLNFIESFEHYIRQKFMGVQDMSQRQALLAEVTADAVNIETAFEIIHAKSDIEGLLFKKLKTNIEEKIKDHSWKLHGNLDDSSKYKTLYVQLLEGDVFAIGFQIDNHRLSFGIFNHRGVGYRLPTVEGIMDKEFGENQQNKLGDAQWIWYRGVDSYNATWSNSSKPWIDIQNGTMANLIYEKINDVEKLLLEANLLSELRRK